METKPQNVTAGTGELTTTAPQSGGVSETNRIDSRNATADNLKSKSGLALGRSTDFVTVPFFLYVAVFLLTPTLIVVIGAFTSATGGFTLMNLSKLGEPNTLSSLGTSVFVSVASALIGSIVGALACYALVSRSSQTGLVRRLINAVSSVLAQFGGVMLAFAFIATIGINGIGTQLLFAATGYQLDPNWLASLPGLVLIYCYFQIPLMIIVFLPAMNSLRPQWKEATVNLGGTTWDYWSKVAGPILWPRFLGAFLLLFANAFSAYATAAALFTQRAILLPLMIQGALRNEQDIGQNGFAQSLALLMVVVVALVMTGYAQLQKRTAQWE
ncbi:MAG: ABC transporter permease subunit [Mobiluncus porci]|uniref:ABC transporter permease n=1 Tax=Mobiluncus porci TaxID=2652278 RepID=UPI0023F55874|nr:ABC transporter permease subunit [Mobiluncus porci]MDD7542223.1 ABC transporter permease subunit [Mobiluncus porci]MDY5747976.1 ABC transporter permease subunit [Mobiluncus porci]